jgi:ABC-type glutathione transport system ATPase component
MIENSQIEPILKVDNLSIIYYNQTSIFPRRLNAPAVDNVSFTVLPGECFAIFGESGCGKTSIINAILGFQKPAGGSICVNNRNIWQIPRRELRRIRPFFQPIFQDYNNSLNPSLKIKKILSEALSLRISGPDPTEKLHELLELVGLLAEILDRYPHQISGGQKQRVALARALILEPRLLILDEPISSQDISSGVQIIKLLKNLQRMTGISFLLISHSLPVVRLLADRVAIMRIGKFIEINSSAKISENQLARAIAGRK